MIKNQHALEKEVIEEIKGIRYSGMESGYAFTSFRENYYEKIQDKDRINAIRKILIDLLKNEHYDPIFRSKVAWICADIALPSIEDELIEMLKEPSIKTTVTRELTYTLERYRLERKIIELIEQFKLSDNDDKMTSIYSKFRTEYFDQIKESSEKSDVINLLLKIVKSNQYDEGSTIKAAWICAGLGIRGIKEVILKMANKPLWQKSSLRSSLDAIVAFINVREGR